MNAASVPFIGAVSLTIYRDSGTTTSTGGYFGPGGYVSDTFAPQGTDEITIQAMVSPTEPQDVQLLPEGDRTTSAITIFAKVPLLIDREGPPSAEADIVLWSGLRYRVARLFDWSGYGYYEALAVQITRK
jgi:hypothetical protein